MSESSVPARMKILDEVMSDLKCLPETADEMASAFYELDGDEARLTLDKCLQYATTAAGALKNNWEGKEDEFTAWSSKWAQAITS